MESYEQKYKEALERASKLRVQNPFDTVSQMMEHVFPELKESEDERIRKGIIDFLWKEKIFLQEAHSSVENNPKYRFVMDAIAWLEMQGNTLKEVTCTQEVEVGNGNIKALVTEKVKTALEAIMEEKSPVESLGISPEKYEGIVNECIYGDGKPVDKVEPKFKAKDWYVSEVDGKIHNIYHSDKTEPKFHEGDWVINRFDDNVWHIDSFDKKNYQVSDGKGNYNWFPISEQDEMRLWTINNAKDGDVLVNGSNIFIFSYLSDTRAMGYCHLNLDDMRFCDDKGKNECFGLIDADFSPATKKQRDLLFAKMREEGFEWVVEKKELKMLEKQGKSMWRDEDEKNLNDLDVILFEYRDYWHIINWLKSLKQRMEEQ